ncbi:MAG: sugar ABC transporter substrate-binding protein [Anaerolineae bacterium]|nr:sugar ABC transporter substrate-binding protein [Anaerolineae bacterium]
MDQAHPTSRSSDTPVVREADANTIPAFASPGSDAERPAITRRGFLRGIGVAAAGAALAGCGTPSAMGPRRTRAVQLVYQEGRSEWLVTTAQHMLEQFHTSNPHISVFLAQDPENTASQMLSDFQNGTAPDVFAGCCDSLPLWAQAGYLLDLRPYVEADLDEATVDDWHPAHYRALFTHSGVQYALPKCQGALVLYYNKDLFDQYGVEYPTDAWTHDDYLEAMRGLVRPMDRTGKIDLWGSMVDVSWGHLQVHVNGWGGHFVDPLDPRRSLMAQPEALEALQWLRDRMWDDHTMASLLDVRTIAPWQAFVEGHLAMVEEGSWSLKRILENANFRVGVAPLPAGPARRATLATADGFAIYAGTRHPEAAWELLKFLISPRYGRAMAQAQLLHPARASLVGEWANLVREQHPGRSRDMDLSVFADGHLRGYSVTAEIFANMAEARRLAQAAWSRIFTLGQAQTDLVRTLSAQIDAAQQAGA